MVLLNINISCVKSHYRMLCNLRSFDSYVQRNMCLFKVNHRNNFFSKSHLLESIHMKSNIFIPIALSNTLLKFSYMNCNQIRCLQHISDHKHISVSNVKNVLSSRKIEIIDGFTCLIIECPFCVNGKKNELYINKVTGFLICSGCKRLGEWMELEDFLKKNKNITNEHNFLKKYTNEAGEKWKQLTKRCLPFTNLRSDTKKLILKKFNLDEQQEDLFKYLNVYVDEDLSNIYVPLKFSTGISGEVVGYKAIKINEKNILSADNESGIIEHESNITEPNHSCRGVLLHKSRNVKRTQAVLVHNFNDFVSLAKLNLNYNVICLPHGLTNLPQEVLPILEKYEKIILWLGNDTSCWDAAKQFAKKLNEDRCFFVRPVKENPSAHVILCDVNSINEAKRIIEKAEPVRHPSIINFSSIRQDVLSELQNIDKAQGVRWKRFPGLNSLVKGFRRGELSIFTGPTGSGKSTFLSEYSLDLLSQGVATLWGSFEVRNQRLARTMLQQYVQLPLDLYPERLNYWADSFERFPLYFMTFHGQQPLKVVLEAVEHASYVHDISHVIIDNVQFMLGMLDSETNLDRFFRQDALIAAFRNFSTSYNCHVSLVIHPRKEKDGEQLTINSVFGGAKASQEADNVFIIQQKMLQSLKIKKYLQVAKNRFSGDLGLIPLDFDKETLSFSTKSDKKSQKKSDSINTNVKNDNITEDITVIEDLHILQ